MIIPDYVRPYLWSYDISKLDLKHDRRRIIVNILNLGSETAVRWLFSVYSRAELIQAITDSAAGEWSPKSWRFWSLIFDIGDRSPVERFPAHALRNS